MGRTILRGQIYYANLDPIVGSEQGGTRPVLIIQNNIGNTHSPTVIVAAMSRKTKTKPQLPTHCYLNAVHGLEVDTLVLLEQIRTIDKQRLKEYIGTLHENAMKKVDVALAISVGINLI